MHSTCSMCSIWIRIIYIQIKWQLRIFEILQENTIELYNEVFPITTIIPTMYKVDLNYTFLLIAYHFPDKDALIPMYSVSKRGKSMLIHNGMSYVQRSRKQISNDEIVTRWRCSYTFKCRYTCTAKAFTHIRNGIETATYSGVHNHGNTI